MRKVRKIIQASNLLMHYFQLNATVTGKTLPGESNQGSWQTKSQKEKASGVKKKKTKFKKLERLKMIPSGNPQAEQIYKTGLSLP
jgi:hypothetical protein